MSYDLLSRRVAGILIAVALLLSPISAAAAPAGDGVPTSRSIYSWSAAWQGLVDEVLGWFGADPHRAEPRPAPSVRDANILGSTLDPDGVGTAPGAPSPTGPFEAPDPALGSTLDPDG